MLTGRPKAIGLDRAAPDRTRYHFPARLLVSAVKVPGDGNDQSGDLKTTYPRRARHPPARPSAPKIAVLMSVVEDGKYPASAPRKAHIQFSRL